MKTKVVIETILDLGKDDTKTLQSASALEVIQTAQLQGAEVKMNFSKVKEEK